MWHCPFKALCKSFKNGTAVRLTQRSIILQGDWLSAVWYCGELFMKNLTKIENILTHWSVAQADSNDEQNWRSKISLECHLNRIWKSHMTPFQVRIGRLCYTVIKEMKWYHELLYNSCSISVSSLHLISFLTVYCISYNIIQYRKLIFYEIKIVI